MLHIDLSNDICLLNHQIYPFATVICIHSMCCVVSSFLSKVFQCLLIGGENVGPDAKRNAETFVISDEQFDGFVQRHKSVPQLVPESNTAMKDSYLILDEYVSYNHALSYIEMYCVVDICLNWCRPLKYPL